MKKRMIGLLLMKKRMIGLLLMIVSILIVFIFIFPINFTGYAIFIDESTKSFMYFIAAFLFIFSIILLASKESLDAIIIPTLASERRTREKTDIALEYKRRYGARYLIASGGKTPALSKQYKHGAHVIYERLRERGVRPAEIKIDARARNNIENILYSLEKLKGTGARKIGIVSYPSHLDRFDEIIETGKREGVIDKNVKFYRIETDEKLIERLYEIPARYLTRKEMRKGIKKAEVPEGWLKTAVNYVMKYFS